ncbi:putative zinc protease protein [Magnetofaba australis IT-1]|uniref:Putative zinc protease protein n=1 Tax=Magnetofaba australis IT-1 TaxID=1434232 RepID=A0A1Y2K8U9_9PROT|nr:putative zinc protease protein [Magnetofaba australis IT-1]
MLADASAAEKLKARLRHAQQARRFAIEQLGLPDNGSYTRYADLGRSYAVWATFAAPSDSLTLKSWSFPLIGELSYRGYFDEAAAQALAAELRQQGYETSVQGIPAYSTLGWFADPLLNTHIFWPESQLAALMFHEMAHELLYIPDDTLFNESFAEAVAQIGVGRWLQAQGDAAAIAAWRARQQARAQFLARVADLRDKLEALYADKALTTLAMRRRKAGLFADFRVAFVQAQEDGPLAPYARWALAEDLNNAKVGSLSLYARWVPAFQRLYEQEGADLERFIAAAKRLGALPAAQRRQRMAALLA